MAQKKRNINWIYILLGAFIFLGVGAWWWHEYGHSEDERFAMSNGRLEATEIDVAAKMSGRLKEVLVQEGDLRSEEHTSELQSRGHLVCRLLLEKKNTR